MRTVFAALLLALTFASPALADPEQVLTEAKAAWTAAQEKAKNATKWEKAYVQYLPYSEIESAEKAIDGELAKAPDHAGLKALKEEIAKGKADVIGEFEKVRDAYQVEEHSSSFEGDADELLASFRKKWGKDEKLLAIRIYNDWDLYKRNDAVDLPTKYIITFELAYPHDTDPDLVKVCYVSGFTEERLGVEKGPPIDSIRADGPSEAGMEYTGLGGLIVSSEWYLAKRSNVNVGLGMSGGGLGKILGILGGLMCCFVLVVGVGAGAFFALKKGKTPDPTAGGAPPPAVPPGTPPVSPPPPPTG